VEDITVTLPELLDSLAPGDEYFWHESENDKGLAIDSCPL
jgi:hypothetical protein